MAANNKAITSEEIWWNLTGAMSPYLDPHQIYRLISFQQEHVNPPIFSHDNLKEQELKVLKTLNMVDMTWEVEREMRPIPADAPMPQEYEVKKERVLRQIEKLEADYEDVREKISVQEVQDQLTNQRDNRMLWNLLKERHGFEDKDLDTIFEYGKAKYDIAEYEEASNAMYIFGLLAPYDHTKHAATLWGKLSSEILREDWSAAIEDLNHLKESLDKSMGIMDPLTLLQWRTWLLHWSLFCYFNPTAKMPGTGCKNTGLIIELFLNTEEYKNAIETICPWLLRYLAVVIVTSKSLERKQSRLNQLIRLIEQEKYNYSDPITDFLLCLNHRYDFDEAQEKLTQARDVLRSDYFLHDYIDEFIENGRVLMFEMFCRIHQKIKIATIAEKLGMTQEDAELWIVELIRNARLDAKIDSENGTIIMGNEPAVPYQQILTKTNNLAMSTSILINSISNKLKGKQSQEIGAIPSWAKQGGGGNKSGGSGDRPQNTGQKPRFHIK